MLDNLCIVAHKISKFCKLTQQHAGSPGGRNIQKILDTYTATCSNSNLYGIPARLTHVFEVQWFVGSLVLPALDIERVGVDADRHGRRPVRAHLPILVMETLQLQLKVRPVMYIIIYTLRKLPPACINDRVQTNICCVALFLEMFPFFFLLTNTVDGFIFVGTNFVD